MPRSFFVGITGGSGSGKTALAQELKRRLGRRAAIVHLDNYQKFSGDLPTFRGMRNWDHPAAVDWVRLLRDLRALKHGRPVTVTIRHQRKLDRPRETGIMPADMVIAEGYLLFHHPVIRRLLNFRVFLTAGDGVRMERRTKFKDLRYVREVLLPMHRWYIEPTRRFAHLILNTEKYSVERCVQQVLERLPGRFVLRK